MVTNVDTTIRGMRVNCVVNISEQEIMDIRLSNGRSALWLDVSEKECDRIVDQAREEYYG